MLDFGLNETTHQLAMANSACCYCHVLRGEDGQILRSALDFEVEGQNKKERSSKTWKEQIEEKLMMVALNREGALCDSKWIVGVNLIATTLS